MSSEQTKLSEFEIYTIIRNILQQFESEVKETSATDWNAFQTLIDNLRTYLASFGDTNRILELRQHFFTFLNFCNDQGYVSSSKYNFYAEQVTNQFNIILSEQNDVVQLVYLIKNLYTRDAIFTDGTYLSDFPFKTVAMLLDIPQKLTSYINSESFRKDLFTAICIIRSRYINAPSTDNAYKYNEYLQILYIIGILHKGVDDAWLEQTVDSDEEFMTHLANVLNVDKEYVKTDIF